MASTEGRVVVLGTGGTIAGTAASATDSVGYKAAQLGVLALVAAVPPLAGLPLESHQVAQIDSCDAGPALWLALLQELQPALRDRKVSGVVITHGTDTLEETAYLLHRLLPAGKPVVLTAAMRPASALQPDGPQNLLDAVTLARQAVWPGVQAVLGGQVFAATDLRKQHGWRVDAFGAGDAGPLGWVQDGQVLHHRDAPEATRHAARLRLPADPAQWPVVDLVTSYAGARGATIDALVAAGAQGLVIAGTGNGSLHYSLREAAQRAVAAGVPVVRASRCQLSGVFGAPPGALPSYGALTAVQARIELMLDLIAAQPRRRRAKAATPARPASIRA